MKEIAKALDKIVISVEREFLNKETSLKEKLVKHFGGTWKDSKETSLSEKREELMKRIELSPIDFDYVRILEEIRVQDREAVLRLKEEIESGVNAEWITTKQDLEVYIDVTIDEIFGEKLI